MAINTDTYSDGEGLRINITGRFDFSEHKAFREAYSKLDPNVTSFTIDLSEASYIDSAALGMLLVLRERAGGNNADITLTGFNNSIGQILDISRFERLFKLAKAQVA